jgi:hypothetical protein
MSLPLSPSQGCTVSPSQLEPGDQSQMPLRRPKWNALRGTSLTATTLPICGTFPSRKRTKHNNQQSATRHHQKANVIKESARLLPRRARSRHQPRKGSQRGPATESYKVRGSPHASPVEAHRMRAHTSRPQRKFDLPSSSAFFLGQCRQTFQMVAARGISDKAWTTLEADFKTNALPRDRGSASF